MWQYNHMVQASLPSSPTPYVLYSDGLYHHGIKGMKWGVRRYQKKDGSLTPAGKKRYNEEESQYREKLSKALKNRNIRDSDKQLFEYRNQSLAKRTAKTAAYKMAGMLVGDILTGNISKYGKMDKTQLASVLTKKAITLAGSTAATVAVNDALAKSASKKYTDDGKAAKGRSRQLFTKEEVIQSSVSTAMAVAPVMLTIAGMKVADVQRNRARNEENFNRWGQNILTEKVSNVVWQSEDFNTVVYDDRKK